MALYYFSAFANKTSRIAHGRNKFSRRMFSVTDSRVGERAARTHHSLPRPLDLTTLYGHFAYKAVHNHGIAVNNTEYMRSFRIFEYFICKVSLLFSALYENFEPLESRAAQLPPTLYILLTAPRPHPLDLTCCPRPLVWTGNEV